MDRKDMDFARCWAKRYVREKHPCGLDVEDVENRILESLHYNKDKRKSLSDALNSIQDESRRNMRALRPWRVRNAAPHREAQIWRDLASDMYGMRIRQRVREDDSRRVRMVIGMLSPDDRRVALDFMDLLSWQKVASRRGMSEGSFRRHVLAGFVSRFKEAWMKIS
jgi:AraC-like DNA-binding protein